MHEDQRRGEILMDAGRRPAFDWNAYYETGFAHPLFVFMVATSIYVVGIYVVVATSLIVAKLIAGILVSLACSKLFVIGHDAAHRSFVPSRLGNKVVGVLAFAMSFHVFGLWEYWHNRVHHAFTNLRSRDFVWRPLSKAEFEECSAVRRQLERIYRHHSGIGLCPYYLLEILLKRMIWNKNHMMRTGRSAIAEIAICYTIWAGMIIFLICGRYILDGEFDTPFAVVINLGVGFLLPLLYLCWAIGFVVFFNHTHPEIRWFSDRRAWRFWNAQMECTLYVQFSGISEFLLPSEVMNHVAHHVDTRIPIRNLRRAQEAFCRAYPSAVKTERWSSAMRKNIMTRCKLYDYACDQWTDFNGKATGPVLS
jgi:acyl-lipid omega-6 desaturase (Delta-12 desaturase)